jgi:hypothetical protein
MKKEGGLMNTNSNVGQILTLIVKITDVEKANWVWENLSCVDGGGVYGIEIFSISEGNMMRRVNFLEERLKEIEEISDGECL